MDEGIENMTFFSILGLNSVIVPIGITLLSLLAPAVYMMAKRKESYSYEGKHVMITGGSSGIGLEVAKLSLSQGSSIVTIIARDEKKLARAKKELLQIIADTPFENQQVHTVAVDAGSSQEMVDAALKPCFETVGPVDVLINSAGTSIAFEFDDETVSSTEFDRMLRVNVLGTVYPTRSVLMHGGIKKQAAKNKGARIVFVSSQVAQCALHGYSAYAASKWALRGIAEALQMEVKPFGILVSVSYPPDTDTPGYEIEMQTKPKLTTALSESGEVFPPQIVARDIITYSCVGYFGISTGLDGWFLKQGHAGMTPLNHSWEVLQQILLGSFVRVIGVFYLLSWESLVTSFSKEQVEKVKNGV